MYKKYGNIDDYIKNELNGDSGRLMHDIEEARSMDKNLHRNKIYIKIKDLLKKINNKLSNL